MLRVMHFSDAEDSAMSGFCARHLFALVFAVALSGIQVAPAVAASIDESHNLYEDCLVMNLDAVLPPDDPNYLAKYRKAFTELKNLGANMEPGEPNAAGALSASIWGTFVGSGGKAPPGCNPFQSPRNGPNAPPAVERVVIHTFGSNRIGQELDTVLAVYTGSAVDALTLVASNDDRVVPGVSTTQSLVQFNATAGTRYSIQLGSGAEGVTGNINANIFVFPLTGGLSAFLATLNNFRAPPGDYVCGYHMDNLQPCPWPKFVLHNSTSQTMIVNASHDLGAGVTTPSQISLAPGALGTMEFQFTPAFNQTAVRTVAGAFTFTGKKTNGTIVNVEQHRALIVVKPATTPPDILRATITPSVQAGFINEGLTYQVRLYNTGTQAAIGCHVRSRPFESIQTVWRTYDPGSPPGGSTRPTTLGPLNAPLTIPAGQSVLTLVTTASHQSRIAVPAFARSNQPFIVDCANTAPAPITLANAFDFTARGAYDPARVTAAKLAPATTYLNVPAAGAGFRVSAVNRGPASTLVARPYYIRPFEETAANKQFTVKVCRASAAGNCTTAEADSIQFSAAEGVTNRFKVVVRPPAVNPGYDPGKRRVFLVFDQVQPVGNIFSVPVASQSIAVRKN